MIGIPTCTELVRLAMYRPLGLQGRFSSVTSTGAWHPDGALAFSFNLRCHLHLPRLSLTNGCYRNNGSTQICSGDTGGNSVKGCVTQ